MLKILRLERHVLAAPSRHGDGSSGPVPTRVVWNLCGGRPLYATEERSRFDDASLCRLLAGRIKADGSHCVCLTATVEL